MRALGRFKKRSAQLDREISVGLAFSSGKKWAKRLWDGMNPRFNPRVHERGAVSVAYDALNDGRDVEALQILGLEVPKPWSDDVEENWAYQRGFWDEMLLLITHAARKER